MVARVPVKTQLKTAEKRQASAAKPAAKKVTPKASRAAKATEPAKTVDCLPAWPFPKSEVTLKKSDWAQIYLDIKAQFESEQDSEIEALHATIKGLLDERDALKSSDILMRNKLSLIKNSVAEF